MREVKRYEIKVIAKDADGVASNFNWGGGETEAVGWNRDKDSGQSKD
jgi:hypothetical protein